ncbi:hypothetical protein [Helicobacter pylori]|uniref:hypothetical protein n=1 Tax=Helicobacter pylori TaxID=210 RepID=UPI0015E67B20|nr:hypothetical protein [Helicobacter pylori]
MAQNNPLYPFKKIMIKSKTMKPNNLKPHFLKILNKTLVVNMRLEKAKNTASLNPIKVTLLEFPLIKASNHFVRLSYRAVE